MLTDVLPQEVEPVVDVRDDGLVRREVQPSLLEEPFHQRHDLVFQQLFRGSSDDEVIGKTDDIWTCPHDR